MIISGHSKGACFGKSGSTSLKQFVHSSHSGVSLALDIFISPGFLKCRVTHLIAGDLWKTFIVNGCHDHLYFLLNFQARHGVFRFFVREYNWI